MKRKINGKPIEEIAVDIQKEEYTKWLEAEHAMWEYSKDDFKPEELPEPTPENSPKKEDLFPKALLIEALESHMGKILLSVGLEKHLIKFIENDLLDKQRCVFIGDEHLKEMGTKSPGKRIAILAEIKDPNESKSERFIETVSL
jgi:hypothetical protein